MATVKKFIHVENKVVVRLVRENYALMRNNPDALWETNCGIWGWTWLNSIYAIQRECGYHPHLQYMIYCYHVIEKRNRRERQRLLKEKVLRYENWMRVERHANYFRKHRYGSDDKWFIKAIEKRTKMVCSLDLPDVGVEVQEDFNMPATPKRTSRCRCCHMRQCNEWCGVVYGPCEERIEVPTKSRSVTLLAKLRHIIKLLVGLRTHAIIDGFEGIEMQNLVPEVCEPQMDGVVGEELIKINTNDVVITEENPGSNAIAGLSTPMLWTNMCSTDITTQISHVTDRFTHYKTMEWNSNHLQESEITTMQCRLPVQFIDSVSTKGNMPMFMCFNVFRYMRTDIEIKFLLNSLKFQSGQLMFSWHYMEDYDGNEFKYMHSRVQLPHVIMNAGSSNEATLTIPYKYINPYMDCKQRANGLKRLYMGTLRCHVLSRLEVGLNVKPSCNVSISIRFPNCSFSGMIDGSLNEPEMMSTMAAMVAAKAISSTIGDINCDKPTSTVVPQYLVPTASHSWSLGTGLVEPLHNLRLNAQTIATGRIGIDNSETTISIPCRTYGMLEHIIWKMTDVSQNMEGYLLWSCDAHPQLDKSVMKIIGATGTLMDTYIMPPVSVISSLYQLWRGSLEFRFDIVCTSFHEARILVAYVPGAHDSQIVTLEQARNSPYVEFDVKESGSFVFSVPFIANKPWWWRKYSGPQRRADTRSPSRIYMYVINPLVRIENVSNQVRIIPYVRAGTDFEVSVPVQPAVGLNYNTSNIFPVMDCCTALDGYWPYYISYSGDFFKGDYYVLQYSIISAARMRQPYLLQSNQYAIYAITDLSKTISFVVPDIDGNNVSIRCAYICLISDGEGSFFGTPFGEKDEEKAFRCAQYIKVGNLIEAQKLMYKYISKSVQSFPENVCWDPRIRSTRRVASDEYVIVSQAQMDDERYRANNLLLPTRLLPSTDNGNFTFNEKFSDLKDLLRRYQLYLTTIISDNKSSMITGDAICKFPVIPSGLSLDVNNQNPIWNSMRDGVIPIILNGYLFFRGSMRFKVVISSVDGPSDPVSIWVQHHPDMPCEGYLATYGNNISNKDRFKNHGYAYYIQTMTVNNIIEFEVPFYQPSMYGVCRKVHATDFASDIRDHVSLGDIVIGVSNADALKSLQLDVYYSIGDDFSISTFRGFDPMLFCNEVFPEMGIYEVCSKMFDKKIEKVSEEVTNRLASTIAPAAAEISSAIKTTSTDIAGQVGSWSKNQLVVSAFSNLAHCLVNPTIKTLAVSIASILLQFISGSIQIVGSLIEAMEKLLTRFWSIFSGVTSVPQENDSEILVTTPQSDGISVEVQSVTSILFMTICNVIGVTCTSGKLGHFNLIRNISSSATLTNNVMTFLRNSSDTIPKLYEKAISYISPKAYYEMQLANSLPELKAWYEECQYLLDSRLKSKLVYNAKLCTRVYEACMFGALLMTAKADSVLENGRALNDLYRDIVKLRNDIIERGVHPDVRFEPFSLWIWGEPGIGKSHIVTGLSKTLMQSVNYKNEGSLIYYISTGIQYWSGCQHPGVLVSDDLFQVSEFAGEELRNFFAINSSCVLNPPMAAIPDKERRINPLLYLMLSNSAFPDLGGGVKSPTAVYRRRKALVEMAYTDIIKEKYPSILDASDIPKEERVNMAHLQFRISNNARDETAGYGPWLTYDLFMEILKERFKEYYVREHDSFRDRMRDMYCLNEDFDERNLITTLPALLECTSLTEKMEIYRNHVAFLCAQLDDPQQGESNCIRKYLTTWKEWCVKKCEPQMDSAMLHGSGETIVRHSVPNYVAGLEVCADDLQAKYIIDTRENAAIDKVNALVKGESRMLTLAALDMEELKLRGNRDSTLMASTYLDIIGIAGPLKEKVMAKFEGNYLDCMDLTYLFLRAPSVVRTPFGKIDLECVDVTINHRIGLFSTLFGCTFKRKLSKISSDNSKPLAITTMTDLRNYLQLILYTDMNYNRAILADYIPEASVTNNVSNAIGCNYLNVTIESLLVLLQRNKVTISKNHLEFLMFEISYPGASMCNCSRYIYDSLFDMSKIEFCPYSKNFTYIDVFKTRRKFSYRGCSSHVCLFNRNRVFRSMFEVVYNDSKSVKLPPYFNYLEAPPIEVMYTSWKERLKCWWKCYVSPVVSSVIDFIICVLPGLLVLVGSILLIGGTSKLVSKVSTYLQTPATSVEIPTFSASQGHNYYRIDSSAKPVINMPKVGVPTFKPQSDQSVRSILGSKISKNTVVLVGFWLEDGVRCKRQCTCLMIHSWKMLVLRHYMEEYSALIQSGYDVTFELHFHNGKTESSCVRRLSQDELFNNILWANPGPDGKLHSNYGIVELPRHIRQFPSIIKYFATKAMHDSVSSTVDMYIFGGSVKMDLPLIQRRNVVVGATLTTSEIVMERVYSYAAQKKGYCGSLIVSNNLGNGNGAIIGMHVAGHGESGYGMAEPLCYEMFVALDKLMPSYDIPELPVEDISSAEYDLVPGNFFMYGTVQPKFAHKESGKTKIVKSLIHGTYPVRTEVNPLRPGDPRLPKGSHPLRDGCLKHGSGFVIPYDIKLVSKVKQGLLDYFKQVVLPVRANVGVLSYGQAICGDLDLPYFESLNWKSSEGFPLQAYRPKGFNDKRWLFDLIETNEGYKLENIHSMLWYQMQQRDRAFAANEKPPTIYVDCLKDTRLLKEKCKIPGKTRIFSIAPIQCTIDIRRHITDFTAGFKNNRIKNMCGIGMNPDSMEWTQLVHYLHEVGTKIITLDYSNYGPTLMSQLVVSSIDIIVDWFAYNGASEQHCSRVRWVLENDILHPIHLSSNLVYETLDGIASGSPLTGELNSIPNMFYIMLTYLEIMSKACSQYATVKDFFECVRLVVYGDDLIMSVNDKICEYFNACSIRDALYRHSIIVTSASKDSKLQPYGTIYEATFLKRGFKPHPTRLGVWLAPVDVVSVEECVNWMIDSEYPKEATMANIVGSMDLAYGHGPDYYKKHHDTLLKAAKSIGCVLNVKTWYERDNDIFGINNDLDLSKLDFRRNNYNTHWVYNSVC